MMFANVTENASTLVCHGFNFLEFQISSSVQRTAASTASIAILASLITSVGNAVTLYTIATVSSLQTAANILLAALALTDLFVGLVPLPIYSAIRIHDYFDIHDCPLKRVYMVTIAIGSGFSIFATTVISIDRYIAVLYTSKYREFHLKTKYMLALLIIFLVWSIFVVLRLVSVTTSKQFNFGIYFSIVLCVLIAIFCYIKILIKIRSQENSIAAIATDVNIKEIRRQEQRRSVTVAIIIVVLLSGYVPQMACMLAVPLKSSKFDDYFYCTRFAELFLMFSSTINPFVYCYRIKNIRKEVVKNIRKLLRKS